MMKVCLKTLYLFFGIIFLSIAVAFPQQAGEVIHINNIPTNGFLLDKGWKFQIGDDPRYAKSSYDDSGWSQINPTLDIHDSLPQIPEGNICWIRIHLSIDSTISQLTMVMQQSVASEIYLNGKLIHRLGVLDTQPDKVIAVNPNEKPLSFPFDKGGEQLLAIRFAKQPGIGYGTHWNSSNPGVSISLNTIEAANAYYQRVHKSVDENDYFRSGVFFILGVLYLAFYVFYPIQRANLLFSIYAVVQATVWGSFIFYHQVDIIETYPLLKNSFLVLQVIGHVIMLLAVYELLKQKKDWIFYGLVVFAVICIPFGIFVYHWGWQLYGIIYTCAFSIAVTWIAFRSFKNNRLAAIIIASGGFCFSLIWVAFIQEWIPTLALHLFTIAHLSVPLAVSLYLGYDFARTNLSLQQKLAEVGRLSEEKQQILTSQNETLEKQVTERTAALEKSMDELKSTQTQLIQSEKMASLGELTAGIAHEIQNPLNFVNNFAEVNKELIAEMDEAISNGNLEEVKGIAKNIADNQEKINQHGKRADAIVKNMLQHSRKSLGQKEPVDINALCEEYLRLAYHGIRAKDKNFTAKFETYLDPTIGKINVVPEDIGRVVLNLINNAFYAVNERSKKSTNDYEPIVKVTTKKTGERIFISVKDSGNGIPDAIKDKIFQPFFTTKPAGQGTGLGLSLSYDIVKTHGGELKVVTVEGGGSEFIVSLPVEKIM
ncbi:MAG TPA: ATP-binding protein [Chryseolinea sp.]|nr:ATP-binding protein [Chryseolinea sp.]